MKNIGVVILFSLLIACKDQYYELDKDPLKGEIEEKEWVFGSGWVKYDPIYTQGLSGILFEQKLTDPCTKVRTVDPHISISIPYAKGNYNLPFSTNNYFVKFSVDGVKQVTASGGFIEIVAVTSFEIVGYLSTNYDDNNHAQGSFSLRLCD